ncbi:hypothetical protein B0T16DRAFT_61639 [Cercophora newfieldiana]|uniref:Uncharacterized protein n=1 Tax=Cercophora newfieldiana TaxID=92897 RepID=A0AA39YRX8_9PEZI|nr:hypothetical protein B0T16DRAFT_61639 [Cercophora newfieldiana]
MASSSPLGKSTLHHSPRGDGTHWPHIISLCGELELEPGEGPTVNVNGQHGREMARSEFYDRTPLRVRATSVIVVAVRFEFSSARLDLARVAPPCCYIEAGDRDPKSRSNGRALEPAHAAAALSPLQPANERVGVRVGASPILQLFRCQAGEMFQLQHSEAGPSRTNLFRSMNLPLQQTHTHQSPNDISLSFGHRPRSRNCETENPVNSAGLISHLHQKRPHPPITIPRPLDYHDHLPYKNPLWKILHAARINSIRPSLLAAPSPC